MIKMVRLPNFALTVLLLVSSLGIVKAEDLRRPYEPVVIGASSIPAVNLPIDELYIYAYKAGGWQQIPFQIDENDGTGYFATAEDGLLDEQDEICFMTADMGDSVASTVWITDAESRAYPRYQITAIDTSVVPAKRSHAYLYRSSTLTHTHASYVTYTPPTGEAIAPPTRYANDIGDDAIQASSYLFKHNSNGIPVDMHISAGVGGDPAIDLLDRWKAFAKGTIWVGEYFSTEDFGISNVRLDVVAGPVRVMRKATYDMTIQVEQPDAPYFQPIPDSVSFIAHFYPYSYYINSYNRRIMMSYGIEILRETMDFNSNMDGAKFYSQLNPLSGFDVDGATTAGSSEDDYVKQLAVLKYNWYILTGARGTVAALCWVPQVGSAQELYYRDSLVPRLYDTGEPGNYGECGLTIKSVGDPIAFDTDSMVVWRYFLGPNHTRGLGDSLLTIRNNPLKVEVVGKTFVVPVELAAFAATARGNGIELTWRTQSESKNYGFEIQRADKPENWRSIGFVRGKGTTNQPQSYSFVDSELNVGTYIYRLKQIDTDGSFEYSHSLEAAISAPENFALEQNYPNPFNPATEIAFRIPGDHQGRVTLKIHNLIGQVIKTLVDADLQPGFYRYRWNGDSDSGEMVGSGAYFYRLEAGHQTATRKLVKLQ
ncbi:MAG TPA: T9SS type A sorting domain-containing protein [bacterium]|nr:T9SS type A sorting domain-containing protein [bacterium]HPG46856.1 T9SS type A sorting domain-containing protein [bacterium]HPM99164.1 T9SS type A sorting domain-containing protein [bacterium]